VNCSLADLNQDGSVDLADQEFFLNFSSYDLNQDMLVVFSTATNTIPYFQYLRYQKVNEKNSLAFYVWARDIQSESIELRIDNAPARAKFTPVIMGDFNNDGAVDTNDLNALRNINPGSYSQVFDLNNDQAIDQLDNDILISLVGQQVQGLLFSWTPGNRDSGFYTITVTATDASGQTNQNPLKITVYDVDALNNYYAYDDVLLIVNDQSAASQQIGDYFAQARGIPNGRMVHISTPENETISRAVFDSDIRAPLEQFILNNKFTNINYLVTTKGVPLRILDDAGVPGADNASVDSELTLIAGPHVNKIGTIGAYGNPYHNFDFPFSREMTGIFLVTRLTGYTVADVLSLIDRAAQPAQAGTFVLDVDASKDPIPGFHTANRWLRDAAGILETAGHFVYLDETNAFIVDQNAVLGYASWGSNDAFDTNNAKTNFSWLPGSIAETFVSTSARTFTSPAVYGQSLIADLIAEGATGAKGYVFEPTLGAIARPDILFDRYAKGYTLADSYYAASANLGWQDVVVGDPKMAITNGVLNF